MVRIITPSTYTDAWPRVGPRTATQPTERTLAVRLALAPPWVEPRTAPPEAPVTVYLLQAPDQVRAVDDSWCNPATGPYFRFPITDPEPGNSRAIAEVHQQIAGLLRGSRLGRMLGDTENAHGAGSNLHDQQHMEPASADGVNVERSRPQGGRAPDYAGTPASSYLPVVLGRALLRRGFGGSGLFLGTITGLTLPNALTLVVDVQTLTVIKSLPVIGGWSCSWAQTHDGSTTWLNTKAPGGRVYRLDMQDDTLELFLETGAEHVHGMA